MTKKNEMQENEATWLGKTAAWLRAHYRETAILFLGLLATILYIALGSVFVIPFNILAVAALATVLTLVFIDTNPPKQVKSSGLMDVTPYVEKAKRMAAYAMCIATTLILCYLIDFLTPFILASPA